MKAVPLLLIAALGFLGLAARPAAAFFNPEAPAPQRPARRPRKLSTKVTSGPTPARLNALSLESLLRQKIGRPRNRNLFLGMFSSKASLEKKEIKKEMAKDRKLIGFLQPEHDLGTFLNGETTRIKTEIAQLVVRFGELDSQLEETMDEGYKNLMRMASG